MVTLTPAPSSLNFASPALGPWFAHASAPQPVLSMPDPDLSIPVSLSVGMRWLAPAASTVSYLVASTNRPPALRGLRQRDGSPAFAPNAMVALVTLLPEAELRLWALTQAIPSPDGSAIAGTSVAVNAPARPRIRHLAFEMTLNTIGDLTDLHPDSIPAAATPETYLGFKPGTPLANAANPVRILRKPGSGVDTILDNAGTAPRVGKLWAFDFRGRAIDPGAVANWWAFMASTGIWDNLWHDGNPQTIPAASGGNLALPTATVETGRVVHITNAHEGPIDPTLLGRLTLSDLSDDGSGTAEDLFTAGPAPSIALSAAPNPDTAPLPRIACLPLGNYAAPGTATPFAGWTGGAFPAGIGRDFTRIGAVDIERQTVGLDRTDSLQASVRTRISPAQNIAAPAVLRSSEAVTAQAMTTLAAGPNAEIMAPVMDPQWGAVTPPALGTGALPNSVALTPLALAGEGTTSTGNSVADQIVAMYFAPNTLPANAWVRIWTHEIDTDTGKRKRMNGGAGFANGTGEAYVVLPLPDGVGAPTDPSADPVMLSCDVMVTLSGGSIHFADERFARPATVSGNKVDRDAVPSGVTFWIAEQGAAFTVAGGQYQSGQSIIALGGTDPALMDLTTLVAADMTALTLEQAVQSGDSIALTEPAYDDIPDGDLASAPNGATLKKHDRGALVGLEKMGRPLATQERRELVAYDRAGATGVIGATPARNENHAAPPLQTGHVGVPAAAEIRGPGVALSGPAADLLAPYMDERIAETLADFITRAATPLTAATVPTSPTTWATVLETASKDMAGEGILRAALATMGPGFTPGQDWQTLKGQIESASGQDIDALIDTTSFEDDILATAIDRVILKTRDGVKGLAASLIDTINRAEDFVYIETPAIDALTAESGAVDVVGALTTRLAARPGLLVMLCVPEKFLPKGPKRLEEIRKAGISGALNTLKSAGGDRVALFSPIAGPGRKGHLAATSIVVDDAILMTGTAHLWRRGLTYDSALSVGLFDETVANGRPAAVRAARMQFMADALGLPVAFLPEDPEDCLAAIAKLNQTGGGNRVRPNAYPAKADTTSVVDLALWNPDGR